MGQIYDFEYEKLVIGIIYCEESYLKKCLNLLKKDYGEVDLVSSRYSFSALTSFYETELGGTTCRQFFSFKNCINPSYLSEIKTHTNYLEDMFSVAGNRKVNVDPCLLGHGKFVMATTKNASFRIPISKGIYAELSLWYSRKKWRPFPWTYYDIKTAEVLDYLNKVRSIYLEQRKELR